MQIIDTHCHLDLAEFAPDRDQILLSARRLGVNRILIPGVRSASWTDLLALCSANLGLYPALGLHPYFISEHSLEDLKLLEQFIKHHNPVAVGEIGLDFYRRKLDKNKQLSLFEAQLRMAKKAGLPVVLHNRKAHEEMLLLLNKHQLIGGICHAFNGSLQLAKRYIALGYKLGFGGMLTYQRSTRLRSLASQLPLEAIVLETDAPDMPPASHQYQRNSPEYLPEILQALAEIRKQPVEEIAQQTTANALAVLGLDH